MEVVGHVFRLQVRYIDTKLSLSASGIAELVLAVSGA